MELLSAPFDSSFLWWLRGIAVHRRPGAGNTGAAFFIILLFVSDLA